jgi:hypothetical protein
MTAPTYFDEKRYSYHLLAPHVSWTADYQQADPTTAFELRIQRQYSAAYDSLKHGQYAKALDAFQQIHNLILTAVNPKLPVNSYWNGQFAPPMDASMCSRQKLLPFCKRSRSRIFHFRRRSSRTWRDFRRQ